MNRGLRNNNPGNIRTGQQFRGEIGADPDGYVIFGTAFDGIRAIGYDLVSKMRRAVDTIAEIITVYAPPSENDTKAYIADVCRRTGFKDDDVLNLNHVSILAKLVTAIITHEDGSCPYDSILIEKACADAIASQLGNLGVIA